jgi:hypothetical protein
MKYYKSTNIATVGYRELTFEKTNVGNICSLVMISSEKQSNSESNRPEGLEVGIAGEQASCLDNYVFIGRGFQKTIITVSKHLAIEWLLCSALRVTHTRRVES